MSIGFGRELQAGFALRTALGADFAEHTAIIRRVAHDRHAGPILGSRTQHRRPADIDVLDRLVHRYAGFGDRLPERIEVHAHHVDKPDTVFTQCLDMFGQVASRQQTAMHFRVQGFDAPVANLGKARHVADVQHLDAALAQQLHRTAHVAIISHPASRRPRTKSTTPVLSLTLTNARMFYSIFRLIFRLSRHKADIPPHGSTHPTPQRRRPRRENARWAMMRPPSSSAST